MKPSFNFVEIIKVFSGIFSAIVFIGLFFHHYTDFSIIIILIIGFICLLILIILFFYLYKRFHPNI